LSNGFSCHFKKLNQIGRSRLLFHLQNHAASGTRQI
jgi:hypothetical protein